MFNCPEVGIPSTPFRIPTPGVRGCIQDSRNNRRADDGTVSQECGRLRTHAGLPAQRSSPHTGVHSHGWHSGSGSASASVGQMMTFMGSPVAKYSKAAFACSSLKRRDMSGLRLTPPLDTSASAVGYRLQ